MAQKQAGCAQLSLNAHNSLSLLFVFFFNIKSTRCKTADLKSRSHKLKKCKSGADVPDVVACSSGVVAWQHFKGSFQYVSALPPPAAAAGLCVRGCVCVMWSAASSSWRLRLVTVAAAQKAPPCPLARSPGTPIYKEARVEEHALSG